MIVVTAATGQLGQLVVDGLLKTVPAADIAVAVRNPEKAAGIAARGVEVRTADYTDPQSVTAALAGADKVLLISGSEVGQREAQHRNVVEAAKQAGVGHLVYTSVLRADTSTLGLAAEHRATEQAIRASGIPFTFLRNGWYTENYAQPLAQAAESGSLIGSARDGKVASATRADYADAAVAALTGDGHQGQVYELAGDAGWTFGELAAELSKAADREVTYRDLPAKEHSAALVAAGVPADFASVLVSYDQSIAAGQLDDSTGQLRALIGRPTTPLSEAVPAILKG